MESELNEILSKSFVEDISEKFIDYKGYFIFETYELIADSIENFEVRDDDVWVCSFPRSGTTWTQEMVWNIANDWDFERAKVDMCERFPFFDYPASSVLFEKYVGKTGRNIRERALKYVKDIAELPTPRFIKTHLPFHLLPRQLREREKKCKIVHVSRNARDSCISYFHFYQNLAGFSGKFENFCKLFMGDKVIGAPYWNHVNGYRNRNDSNILFIKYEDMKIDLRSIIKKVGTFLGKTSNEEQLKHLENHLSFTSMKNNPAVNLEWVSAFFSEQKIYGENFEYDGKFMRSGEMNQWKTVMSEELSNQFDVWIKKKFYIILLCTSFETT